jgi:hypothetical protein
LLKEASEVISSIRISLEKNQEQKEKEQKVLKSQIDSLTVDIDDALKQALPSWARGLLSADNMVVLYPWILIGIAIFLVATALRSAHHFRAMADSEGWTVEERRDPLLSTLWTLVPRGRVGTAVTFVNYTWIFGVLGICLYRLFNPPGPKDSPILTAQLNSISATSGGMTYVLLGAVFLLIVIALLPRGAGKQA